MPDDHNASSTLKAAAPRKVVLHYSEAAKSPFDTRIQNRIDESMTASTARTDLGKALTPAAETNEEGLMEP